MLIALAILVHKRHSHARIKIWIFFEKASNKRWILQAKCALRAQGGALMEHGKVGILSFCEHGKVGI